MHGQCMDSARRMRFFPPADQPASVHNPDTIAGARPLIGGPLFSALGNGKAKLARAFAICIVRGSLPRVLR